MYISDAVFDFKSLQVRQKSAESFYFFFISEYKTCKITFINDFFVYYYLKQVNYYNWDLALTW